MRPDGILALGALAACRPSGLPTADTDGPFADGTPAIEALSWACDPDLSRWSFVVRTTAWSAGGTLWFGRSVADVEKHAIWSDEAAADGTWDCLEMDLDVVADWRDATSGSSTRWRCADALELSFALQVTDPRGDEVTDCRAWGADPALWEQTEDVPDCEVVWEPEVSTDTGDTGNAYAAGEVEGCG